MPFFSCLASQIFISLFSIRSGSISPGIGPGQGPIWMDDLACNGAEVSIADCKFNGWGNHSYDHGMDAAVRCLSCNYIV